ncbi:NADH-quinone oxidoreductase subunit E [Pilimelia anulata]|uniref:NADH-quinone oxidoreductase subunit E n=1 Tax=Pilimelia anulata TaxID=53371 RepID=A0A8J3F9X0_9ACTN|nr:NADH-quinone oxidoreductase subunit NuoE [Pilimelia anulata]GGJ95516.1 NADH-quinone oxidoreductase subunit E [Pilimelia anulata]
MTTVSATSRQVVGVSIDGAPPKLDRLSPAAAALRAELGARTDAILARYPDGPRSALLPLLHLVQSVDGQVTPAGVEYCAAVLGIQKAQVAAVATFYTMYKRKPTGEYLVSVCTNTMCNVLGGQEVYDTLSELLGVGHDETSADGRITLEHAECLAACDYGPVLTVNYDFHDEVTPDRAVEIVNELRAAGAPAPSRGARPCSLREMAVQLAGFPDEREGAVAGAGAGPATLRGNLLADRYGIAVPDFDPHTPIRTGDGNAAATAAGLAANKPASDAKPAGDAPAPQREHLEDAKEARK